MSTLEYAPHGQTFITADTHFGHAEACELFDRPFTSTSEMDAEFIATCNNLMGPDDLLYHVGDFVGGAQPKSAKIEQATSVRNQLNVGRIILVQGNHDSQGKKYRAIFDDVHDIISVNGWRGGSERVVLSHYPLQCWQGNRHGSLHCYGHTHGRLEELGRSTDVGVDCWNYTPIEIDHVLRMLASRDIDALPATRNRRQPIR